MPVNLTKKQLNEILVAERKKSRERHRHSAFMSKSRSIYNGQVKRWKEWTGPKPDQFPYTLEEFREWMQAELTCIKLGDPPTCCYCPEKLTLKRFTPDHKKSLATGGTWELSNLAPCCQRCNYEKGILDSLTFRRLLTFLSKYCTPEEAADIKRRLSIGGKWSPR